MKPGESIAHGKMTTTYQRRGEQRPGVQKTWNGSAAECSEEINTGAGFLPFRFRPSDRCRWARFIVFALFYIFCF